MFTQYIAELNLYNHNLHNLIIIKACLYWQLGNILNCEKRCYTIIPFSKLNRRTMSAMVDVMKSIFHSEKFYCQNYYKNTGKVKNSKNKKTTNNRLPIKNKARRK